jgi:hypothetical protein
MFVFRRLRTWPCLIGGGSCNGGIISHLDVLRCGISNRPMSARGQNLRLPHRNIGIRFTPVSRQLRERSHSTFRVSILRLLDSAFVLTAIQSLD